MIPIVYLFYVCLYFMNLSAQGCSIRIAAWGLMLPSVPKLGYVCCPLLAGSQGHRGIINASSSVWIKPCSWILPVPSPSMPQLAVLARFIKLWQNILGVCLAHVFRDIFCLIVSVIFKCIKMEISGARVLINENKRERVTWGHISRSFVRFSTYPHHKQYNEDGETESLLGLMPLNLPYVNLDNRQRFCSLFDALFFCLQKLKIYKNKIKQPIFTYLIYKKDWRGGSVGNVASYQAND